MVRADGPHPPFLLLSLDFNFERHSPVDSSFLDPETGAQSFLLSIAEISFARSDELICSTRMKVCILQAFLLFEFCVSESKLSADVASFAFESRPTC